MMLMPDDSFSMRLTNWMHSLLGRTFVIHSFMAVNDVFTCGLGEANTMPAGLM